MTDNRQNTTSFKCECGKAFTSESEYREHQKTHGEKGRAARAGVGTQKSTAIGQEQGEDAPGDNQKGREESQQGWREPTRRQQASPGNQQGQPVPNKPQVPQETDENEWKHGKQEDDTENKMTDDWGKSDKH